MRLLGRYVFREILSSTFLGTFLATFVIFLHSIDKIFEVLVHTYASPATVITLFALAMPPVLPWTIPFGMLVGILIGLGRMASDGEVVAMRACGVSSRKVIVPVLLFATLAGGLAAFSSLRLAPLSFRETTKLIDQLLTTRLSAAIEPRVFDEDFSNTVLYVSDAPPVRPGDPALWRNVFMADVTPPEQRTSGGIRAKADGPLITVARDAVVISDLAHNRIQLALTDAAQYEMATDGTAHDSTFPQGEQALDASPSDQSNGPAFNEMNTRELARYAGPDWIEARVELHRRYSLPVACIMLALVGIPLGIVTRKGGKSAAYIMAVFLAFFCYHLSSITLIGVARQQKLPVPFAMWLPDAVFGIAGVIFLIRMERPGDRDLVGEIRSLFAALKPRRMAGGLGVSKYAGPRIVRLPLLPQLIDTYILTTFVFHCFLWLASLVMMTLVYNFFELVPDMIHNHISLAKMFTYLFFLSPSLIYQFLPISVLLAVLGAFGVMSKQNEVTAFKACGVSLYRMATPVFVGSILLSAGLFAFDYYYVPGANRTQDALRDEIKGRATQTYLNPDRKWIWGAQTGDSSRIFYYRYFDPKQKVMAGVYVFDLESATFRLEREISAERARWDRSRSQWIFENGWASEFRETHRRETTRFASETFPEITEAPDYFLKAPAQDKQMNFLELETYIRDLRQSGFDTISLQVRLHRKFSVPLFAMIMAMIAIPFAFLVGNRGAMTGIGVSLAIALTYWGISTFFEKVGDVNQLPPQMAAWSPDAVFALAGMYLMTRMRS
jgi:LPS export ABC transporter permease LptG/LPS export ABC transporter permease LptF